MNEDQIVARAKQEVWTRRVAAAEQQWNGAWPWLLPAGALAALVTFLVAPGALPDKLLWSMGGVCNVRPTHSYFAGGLQLPLEARMVGIYGGFMVTFALLVAMGRFGARRMGQRWVWIALAVLFLSMVFDGVNSTLMELGWFHLYTTTNLLRLATGLLAGIAIAPFLLWTLTRVVLPRTSDAGGAVIGSPRDLLALIAANAVFAALVLQEWAWLYYPVGLIGVLGIVVLVASVALLIVAHVSEIDGRVVRLRQLIAPGSLALLLSFAVIAGTATLRWSMSAP